MKQKSSIVCAIIPLLFSACSILPVSTPTMIISPTAAAAPRVIPSITQVVRSSPIPLTDTPTTTISERPAQSPEATIRSEGSEEDVFCPSSNEEAQKAYNDANNLRDDGKLTEAEQLFLHAIELDPAFCDAMDNLGQILRQQGRVDEAVGWYLMSLEIMPGNTMALQNIALAYKLQGEIEKAIDAYNKLIDLAPDNPEGYFGLGSIYCSLQQSENAIEYLELAEKLYKQSNSPYVSDAQYYLGFAHFDLQNYIEAKKYLEPIYDQFSEDGGINYVLGVCYLLVEPVDVVMARKYILKAQELGIQVPADVLKAIEN